MLIGVLTPAGKLPSGMSFQKAIGQYLKALLNCFLHVDRTVMTWKYGLSPHKTPNFKNSNLYENIDGSTLIARFYKQPRCSAVGRCLSGRCKVSFLFHALLQGITAQPTQSPSRKPQGFFLKKSLLPALPPPVSF